jgi:hypothetical protein
MMDMANIPTGVGLMRLMYAVCLTTCSLLLHVFMLDSAVAAWLSPHCLRFLRLLRCSSSR